jgi:hypothetical protein
MQVFQKRKTSRRAGCNALQTFLPVILVAALSPSLFAQSTITCTSPQWDMLQIMRMQTTWAQAHYYLSGTSQSGSAVYMYQAASDVTYDAQGQWTGGKENYIKTYALPPATIPSPSDVCDSNCGSYEPPKMVPHTTTTDTPKYSGYPADVDLFDMNYVYLWITEVDWNNPYSFKKFNSNSSDYSFRFAPRCGVPGQVTLYDPAPNNPSNPTNNPSSAFEILPANVYQSGGQYNGDIISSNETFTSSDCKNGCKWDNLGYAYTQVNAAKSGFTMTDHINGTRSLNYVPIVYWYNCSSSYASCGNHEEFDYGYYATTGDNYGLVQWLHFTGTQTNPDQTATFNSMSQYTGASDGHYDYTNINFPAAACFQ